MRADDPSSPFGAGGPFFLIAGPCVLEGRDLNLRIARHVWAVSRRCGIPAYFKASFDKANRTSLGTPRGPGLAAGLELLREVREEVGIPVLTDVHLPSQVESVARVVDAVQVPAFLSRQTDLLAAVGGCGRPVNLKKGQWMAPEQMAHSVEKVRAAGAREVAVTERGNAFGYGRWVVDMRSFSILRESAGCPAVFDATHAVQMPGGEGRRSGGEPRFIEPLARAAVAAGADGLFLETHPRPGEAPSDGSNMLPAERLEPLLESVLRVRESLGRSAGGGDTG
ncbi:MAG: 3-deoxy-8-phosphooctulonate synthase [Gemmatimonadota bacterium]